MLAGGVVDQHHRESKLSGAVHLAQAENACGRFFAAADHLRDQVAVFRVHHVDQVAAVVNDDVRGGFQDAADAVFILFGAGAVDGEDVEAFVHEGGCDIVLGAQGIAAGDEHLRAAGGEHFAQVGRLGFEMDAEGNPQSLEREGLAEVFFRPNGGRMLSRVSPRLSS